MAAHKTGVTRNKRGTCLIRKPACTFGPARLRSCFDPDPEDIRSEDVRDLCMFLNSYFDGWFQALERQACGNRFE